MHYVEKTFGGSVSEANRAVFSDAVHPVLTVMKTKLEITKTKFPGVKMRNRGKRENEDARV